MIIDKGIAFLPFHIRFPNAEYWINVVFLIKKKAQGYINSYIINISISTLYVIISKSSMYSLISFYLISIYIEKRWLTMTVILKIKKYFHKRS